MIEITSNHDFVEAVKELERRRDHRINTHVPTNLPNHDQLSFHTSRKQIRLLFGGNQSGKSLSAAAEIAYWARGVHPFRPIPEGCDIEIWVIAPEYILIEKGIWRHLKTLIPDWEIIKIGPTIPQRQLPSYCVVKRKGGYEAIIQFISARGDDRAKFQAAACHLIAIDEEIPGEIWEELEARTLVSGGEYIISGTLVESYEWITKLEDMALADHPDIGITRLNTAQNPYVDKKQLERMMSRWSADVIEYRIEGKSRRVRGIMFNQWDREIHECPTFAIPKEWPRWFALDPGWRTCAGLWIAVSPEDKKYAYRELYAHNESLYKIAVAIKEAEGCKLDRELSKALGHYVWEEGPKGTVEEFVVRVVDDVRESHSVTGELGVLHQMANKYGILFSPAQKQVVAGIEEIRYWLENKEFQCMDHMHNFLDERRGYRVKEISDKRDRPESPDKPVKRKDHLMDSWRFIANEQPKFSDRDVLTGDFDLPTRPDPKPIWDWIEDKVNEKQMENEIDEVLGSNW